MIQMKKILKDKTGLTYGYLYVKCRGEDYVDENGKVHVMWICDCHLCGKKDVLINGRGLKEKRGVKSCGCLHAIVNNDFKKLYINTYKI